MFDFILEGQQLEHLGCELPVVVRTVIMRKNLLLEDMESVSKVINEYNGIIAKLNTSEVSFYYNKAVVQFWPHNFPSR